MTLEEAIVAKLQRLPESTRAKILTLIDEWIEQHSTRENKEAQHALAVVQTTWATLTLDPETLHWVAEDKELEYDLG
ncbi:MAG: hypothetical protein FJ147_24655 [Deltaproteobacteria bacterium]|nr:hypothetical protein [Deltaproteobacteria bacterium]